MEDPWGESPVPTPANGGRPQIAPGLRKLRPRDNTRILEGIDLIPTKPSRVFNSPITVTIPTGHAASDFRVQHSLGVVPSDIMYGTKNANEQIWRGTKAWTRSEIYLRSSNAVTVTIYLVP